MVPSYLGQLYSIVGTPVISADHATVDVRLFSHLCHVSLDRAGASATGWLVQSQQCEDYTPQR